METAEDLGFSQKAQAELAFYGITHKQVGAIMREGLHTLPIDGETHVSLKAGPRLFLIQYTTTSDKRKWIEHVCWVNSGSASQQCGIRPSPRCSKCFEIADEHAVIRGRQIVCSKCDRR